MAEPEAKPLTGISVLIVDDDPDALQLLEMMLTHHGALTVTASDGKEALARLARIQVDIVVSDLAMPGFSGYDFLLAVRSSPSQVHRSLPAIALTAFDEHDAGAAASASGFQSFLVKPVELSSLVREIRRLTRPQPSP